MFKFQFELNLAQYSPSLLKLIPYNELNLELEFHNDTRFHCRDVCKMILAFLNQQFSIYFTHQRWMIIEWVQEKSLKEKKCESPKKSTLFPLKLFTSIFFWFRWNQMCYRDGRPSILKLIPNNEEQYDKTIGIDKENLAQSARLELSRQSCMSSSTKFLSGTGLIILNPIYRLNKQIILNPI